eukprot:COSAG06_NODE_27699_length_588_cov_0.740286_2_plen_59_part_01
MLATIAFAAIPDGTPSMQQTYVHYLVVATTPMSLKTCRCQYSRAEGSSVDGSGQSRKPP